MAAPAPDRRAPPSATRITHKVPRAPTRHAFPTQLRAACRAQRRRLFWPRLPGACAAGGAGAVGLRCGALCVPLRAVTWLVHLQRRNALRSDLLAAAVLALSFHCVSALSYGDRAGQARLSPAPSACTACPSAGTRPLFLVPRYPGRAAPIWRREPLQWGRIWAALGSMCTRPQPLSACVYVCTCVHACVRVLVRLCGYGSSFVQNPSHPTGTMAKSIRMTRACGPRNTGKVSAPPVPALASAANAPHSAAATAVSPEP